MAGDRRPAEELSIEELEAILVKKKMEAREARLRSFRKSGRALHLRTRERSDAHIPEAYPGGPGFEGATLLPEPVSPPSRFRTFLGRVLLVLEIAAVAGLAYVVFNGFMTLRQLNQEAAENLLQVEPSPTPLIYAVVLPSGHTPPTSEGGAAPNEAEIPENLRPLVQSLAAIPIPTPGPEQASSIFIPALWNAAAPVVQGDGWEQLKKGVGQHVGSANPGMKGNLVLSAHNDIWGKLFRYLDRLDPGDEILVSTTTHEYLYRVTGTRIVSPTEVSVMLPTERPTVTLISCYPYMVDNQRIVVFGELVEE